MWPGDGKAVSTQLPYVEGHGWPWHQSHSWPFLMFTAQIQAVSSQRRGFWTLTCMALFSSVQSSFCFFCVALMESAPGGISSPFLFFWWPQSHGMPWLSWALHEVICKDCPSSNSWHIVAVNLKRPCPPFPSTADCMNPSPHQLSEVTLLPSTCAMHMHT